MLPKKRRLPRRLFVRGGNTTAVTGRYLRVSRREASEDRYAAVVGKKVAPSAVVRNAIRRRVYAAIAEIRKDTELHGHFTMLALPAARTAKLEALESDLRALCRRASAPKGRKVE